MVDEQESKTQNINRNNFFNTDIYTNKDSMKTSITEHQAVITLIVAGFIGALARWLSGEKMTFGQYIGRSILNSLFALAAFSINIFYPDADNIAVVGSGIFVIAIGPTSTELLFQRLIKK